MGVTVGDYENVPVVEFMYLVFTRMPVQGDRRRLGSLLPCLCDVFRALINSLVCCFCRRFKFLLCSYGVFRALVTSVWLLGL